MKQAAHQRLADAVQHHLNLRAIAQAHGLLGPQQAPQGGLPGQPQQQQPTAGQPAPQMAQPVQQGQQPPMPNRQTLMSKAPEPLDPTMVADVRNRPDKPLNSLAYGDARPGRSAAASAGRSRY